MDILSIYSIYSIYSTIKNINKYIDVSKQLINAGISNMTISGNNITIGASDIKVTENSVIVNGNSIKLNNDGLPEGISPEDPNFLNILKALKFSKYEIQTILIDYYNGESLKDILKHTLYVSLVALAATVLIYPIVISGPEIVSLYKELPKSELYKVYNKVTEVTEGNGNSDDE